MSVQVKKTIKNIILKNKKILILLFLLIASLISVYSLYYFWINKIYFIGSDTYFYWSIADSVAKNGELKDLTIIPSVPTRTPQIGIIIFHLILSKIGINGESRFIFIMLIFYLLHLSALYPINQIAKRAGLISITPRIFLFAAYLGAWHIYRSQLLVNNDGFFNALSIWFVYLLVIIHQDLVGLKISDYLSIRNKNLWVLITTGLLSTILVFFRLQIFLIHFSAMFSAIILKKYRAFGWNFVFLILSTVSLIIFFINIDSSNIIIEKQTSKIMVNFIKEVDRTLFDIIPSLLYNYNLDNWVDYIVIPIIGIVVWIFFHSIRQKNYILLLLSSICCSAFLWVTTFGYESSRYILFIYTFIYLLVLIKSKTRIIGFLFVFLVMCSSIYNLVRPFERPPASRIILYLHENKISLPTNDPLLLSTFERHPYFFLNSSTFQGDLTFEKILEKKEVFVLADDNYTQKKISEITFMAQKFNYSFQSRSLIPDYNENEIKKGFSIKEFLGVKIGKQQHQKSGYDLIQLYNFKKKV